jgi:UDP-N-acetylmuramoylalanine--D-glutamate ligase
MPLYHQAKHRIFRGCRKAVINSDDPLTTPLLADEIDVVKWGLREPGLQDFGLRDVDGRQFLSHGFEPLLAVDEMIIVGRHNTANALAALSLGFSAGLPLDAMLQTLKTFRGLPHRCEAIATIGSVQYVNDSKGTNVGATVAALAGLGGERDIVLIAGGQGKGADFSQLRAAVDAHCKQLVLIGEDAPLMQKALRDIAPVSVQPSMAAAVRYAADCAGPGDTVLLSPACASFDMFSGYVARGEAFAAAVRAMEEGV